MKYQFKAKDLKTGEWVTGDLAYAKLMSFRKSDGCRVRTIKPCPQCGRYNNRDLLAAVNIKRFGLQKLNLIEEISPVVNRVVNVELSTFVEAKKR